MFMVRILCFLFSLLTSTFRSRLSLHLEIAALRHQLSSYCQKLVTQVSGGAFG